MAKFSKKQLTKEITDYINTQLSESTDPSVQALFKTMPKTVNSYFHHSDSLRLKGEGNKWLSIYFDSEKFEMDRQITTGELILLAQKLNSPFFISLNSIRLYSTEQIVLFKLCGDVTSWLNNFR